MLINVFRIIRKSQVGEFDQGLSLTLQESGSREPDLSVTALHQVSQSGVREPLVVREGIAEVS